MKLQLGSAPVSWGIFEFADIQPRYPWSQVLDEIAATGYSGTELGPFGYLPTDPQRLQAELEKRGLQLLSAFVPVALTRPDSRDKGRQAALAVGRLLAACGAKVLVVADDNGSQPELVAQAGRRRGTALKDWKGFARGVQEIVGAVRDELGLQVVFHHHCAGNVETPEEIRALLDHSEVGLCLDTGHWHYGGGDALECLREWGGRVSYLHFKDCDPVIAARCRRDGLDYFTAVKAGLFCPLGEGEVDFSGLLAELKKLDYQGWAVVEQDVLVQDLEAPRRFSRQNREYLRGLGL